MFIVKGNVKIKEVMMKWFTFILSFAVFACGSVKEKVKSVKTETYGQLKDGTSVNLYTLTNQAGMEVKITEYGGIIVSVKVPDRDGILGDVVLGYDSLAAYLDGNPFFGCLVGRYANRIAGGKFTLDGQTYQLAQNNGANHLHGGLRGFDKVIWKGAIVGDGTDPALKLHYLSKDGEENYPGNLDVTVVYTLTEDNRLSIDYRAVTDKKTIVNLSNHTYFNLRNSGDILSHQLLINADYFTPIDSSLIPTGELRPVNGTPFDFRQLTEIGTRINSEDQQIKNGMGYDHNFVVNKNSDSLSLVAQVFEPETGRLMEVYSTEPGVQFYSGNFLNGSNIGKNGTVYNYRSGFCLETQHFPDSPNKENFPSTVLEPGEKYHQLTVFRFSTK
jgi:aldose 1-epimerase